MNTKNNQQQRLSKRWIITIILLFTGFGASAQEWTNWTIWKSTCYQVSYRFREKSITSDKKNIQVELKNNYNHGISISFRISNSDDADVIYRTDIDAGDTKIVDGYVDKNRAWHLILGKLRYDGDSYGDAYRGQERCVY